MMVLLKIGEGGCPVSDPRFRKEGADPGGHLGVRALVSGTRKPHKEEKDIASCQRQQSAWSNGSIFFKT